MNHEETRTDANSPERSPDHKYILSIENTAELYANAGHPRTARAIQKYCAVGKLDCRKVETETGERYLVAPYSIERHIHYINEVRPFANARDQSRTDANVRHLQNKDEPSTTTAANGGEHSRTDANVREQEDRYIRRLEQDNEFLRAQIGVKDEQIKDLTERARETNILIHGLQKMLTPLLGKSNDHPDARDPRSTDIASL